MISRFEKKRENENLAYFCNMMMSIHLCSEIVRVPRLFDGGNVVLELFLCVVIVLMANK